MEITRESGKGIEHEQGRVGSRKKKSKCNDGNARRKEKEGERAEKRES